ncbi:hypothetical protein [Ruminococcus flavefaciens]|uniref:Uncharacterized protein n=1 Tax=Ruminococcus flavefaciens 007c TaxID=1341157 RepID=W7UIJ9_RUMFL|nr:hypothetical protein [Ruminococcus flavefaciens]EWM55091.1 hypothetical protein RF007C_05310 [Ruminococcus flavefaciens 007c]
MVLSDKIDALMDKKAYLIDIFPKTVPQRADNRYFAVEKYFQQNRFELERKLTYIILKLYCYYDLTVVIDDNITENPQADELTVLLEKCFSGELRYINIVLPECEAMLLLNYGELYITAYNVSGELKELLAQLVSAEGMFFYEAPHGSFGEE